MMRIEATMGIGHTERNPVPRVHSLKMGAVLTRPAMPSEQKELEQLQLRASLGNVGDRDALLAHPDAIGLGVDQIALGRVFVSECEGEIVGFAAVERRGDGDSELDAMFVEPRMQRRGIGKNVSRILRRSRPKARVQISPCGGQSPCGEFLPGNWF